MEMVSDGMLVDLTDAALLGAYAAGETYFPDDMTPQRFYEPTDRGLEARIRQRLEEIRTKPS